VFRNVKDGAMNIGFDPARIGVGLLSVCAAYQVGMGSYFMALRPTLLPEDERAIGGSLAQVARAVPELAPWLNRVFVVLGGQAVATGFLGFAVIYLLSRAERPLLLPLLLLALAGLFSVVLISAINFLIGSDFRWVLIAPAVAWIAGVLALALRPRRAPVSAGLMRHEPTK
jgi:hypothetical protein